MRNRFSDLYSTFFLKIHNTKIIRSGKSLKYIAGYKGTMCHGCACQDIRIGLLCKFFLHFHKIRWRYVSFPKRLFIGRIGCCFSHDDNNNWGSRSLLCFNYIFGPWVAVFIIIIIILQNKQSTPNSKKYYSNICNLELDKK